MCDSSAVAISKELSSNIVLLVLRLVVGVNMVCLHGWDKLQHFSSRAGSYPDVFGIGHRYSLMVAVAGEFFGGLLLATGLFGRIGAFLVALVVGMTLFSLLRGTSWHERELWTLYFAGSLTVLILGCGRYSLDSLIGKKLGKASGKSSSPGKR